MCERPGRQRSEGCEPLATSFQQQQQQPQQQQLLLLPLLPPLPPLHHQALLDPESEALRATLAAMTSNMLGLHGVVQRFNEVVRARARACACVRARCVCVCMCDTTVCVPCCAPQVQSAERRLQAKQYRIKERTAAGEWGTVAGEAARRSAARPPMLPPILLLPVLLRPFPCSAPDVPGEWHAAPSWRALSVPAPH